MSESGPRNDPFSDVISLVAGPIAAVIRSFDQLRKGSEELLRGLENFNTTMATLNETALRVNGLLNEFEEPVRVMLPQVTRTLQTADDIADRIVGPLERVIPGLDNLADTLNSDVITSLPTDLGSILEAMNDLVGRLAPLAQVAELAGGMFGIKLPGVPQRNQPTTERAQEPAAAHETEAEQPAAKMFAAERSPAKSTGSKRTSGKKSAAKKSASRKKT